MSQTLQSVLCITINKYLVHVLVVLLHARFSVVGPIPFLLAAIFFSVHPYIGSSLRDNENRLSLALARADVGLTRLLVGNRSLIMLCFWLVSNLTPDVIACSMPCVHRSTASDDVLA